MNMKCRFCEHTFEQGGREAVKPILTHVAQEHPTELLNLCVRLPFQAVGGNTTELAYQDKGEKIQPIPATPEGNARVAERMGQLLAEARPNGGEFVPEDDDFPEYEDYWETEDMMYMGEQV